MKGIVFGVFDGLHAGHKHFLSKAKAKCDELVVVVAPDEAARVLKGRAPRRALSDRMKNVIAFDSELRVVPGDETQGSWRVLVSEKPDVVLLGYDQDALGAEIEKRGIPVEHLSAHEPEQYKSSIMNGKPSTLAES